MTPNEIEAQIMDSIQEIMEVYALSSDEAITLLRYYSWDQDRLNESLMSDLEGAKIKAGISLPDQADSEMATSDLCIICYNKVENFAYCNANCLGT